MSTLDDVYRPLGNKGRHACQSYASCLVRSVLFPFQRAFFQWQFNDAMTEPLANRDLCLDTLLRRGGTDGSIYSKHLVIACHHLACRARLALVEQDEVLHDVKKSVMRQHSIEQHLSVHIALFALSSRF